MVENWKDFNFSAKLINFISWQYLAPLIYTYHFKTYKLNSNHSRNVDSPQYLTLINNLISLKV